jgi:hypothetical protein
MQKIFRLFLFSFLALFLLLTSVQLLNFLLNPGAQVLGLRTENLLSQATDQCRPKGGYCSQTRTCPNGSYAIYVGRSGCTYNEPYCCIPSTPKITPTTYNRPTSIPRPSGIGISLPPFNCQEKGGKCLPSPACEKGFYNIGAEGCSQNNGTKLYCCYPMPQPSNIPTYVILPTTAPSNGCPKINAKTQWIPNGKEIIFDLSSPKPLICPNLVNTTGIQNLTFINTARDSAGNYHWSGKPLV